MNFAIAKLHRKALPNTLSSRMGEWFVAGLYGMVQIFGYVKTVKRDGKTVGVLSGIGKWILTLAVEPVWQRKGVGRELFRQLGGKRYVYTEERAEGFYQKMGFVQMFKIGRTIVLCKK